jgi:outer membrane protein assembly factor BamD (BamD/ComL family)
VCVLLLALSSGCYHKSLLTDPKILQQTAASSTEKETLVLQAANWEKPQPVEPGTPQGDLYIGEALFRAEDYAKAARAFEEVADKHTEVADVHERALFMKAESEYQLGHYSDARDSFQEFRKAYPGSRHVSSAMQHLFAISDAWLDDARKDVRHGNPSSANRFLNFDPDRKPIFDIDGHAIETLKYVHENDPNGPLADDSLMMAAGYHFTMGDYTEAANLTDQLIHNYPHSEFQAQAHLMNAESKINSYKGHSYDSRKLEEARRTLRSAVAQFPNQTESDRQRVMRELEEIRQEQAKAQFEIAEWYHRMARRTPKMADTYNRSARLYYQYVQKNFPGTKWADRATEQLAEIPDVPPPQPKIESSSAKDSDEPKRWSIGTIWKKEPTEGVIER